MKFPTPRLQEGWDGHGDGSGGKATVRDESHVLVAMTLGQAEAAVAALDLFSRIGIGQLEEIAQLIRFGEVPVRADFNQPRQIADIDKCEQIDDLMHQVKALMGFSRGASNGVGNPHNTVKSMRAYELKKAIARAVATRPGSTVPSFSVDRDGIGPRYTTDVIPEATWVAVK